MAGIFTVSLDFELHWGGFEKWPLKVLDFKSQSRAAGGYLQAEKHDYANYFLNTRQVIPEMLTLFAAYEVHATWATVGMLFHPTKAQLLQYAPDLKPDYTEKKLSAYNYVENHGIGEDEDSDPFHFAPSLIRKIVETPDQELASHSFAHYYCNEPGQNLEQFRADLKAAQRSALLFGRELKSLVFPRNQFNDEYLKVCFEEGVTAVRSNPLDWFWHIQSTQSESLWKRANRGLDAYLPIGKRTTYPITSISRHANLPICLPASRLLRPHNPRHRVLNQLRIRRICNEMTSAARYDHMYHLWWHPHNFGAFPEESLKELQFLLEHYSRLCKKFKMISKSMNEVADHFFQ
jgi:Polysaccharide deacetylase.